VRSVASGLALLTSVAVAAAQELSTTTMTCRAAAGVVQTKGAAVFGTGRDTFDRFVRDASFCAHGQTLRPGFAPSLDDPSCLVGWICFEEPRETR
jgi:hypothetical protein